MSNIPDTKGEKLAKMIIVPLVALAVIAAIAFGGYKLIELKNAPVSWSDASIKTPDNISVSFNSEAENGPEIKFTTNTDRQNSNVIRLYEDASCSHCAELAEEIKGDLADKVSENSDLYINMMAFMDNNTGTDYSRKNLVVLTTLAANGDSVAAWKYYNAIWQNQNYIRENHTMDDFASIAKEFGASQTSVDQIKNASLDGASNIDQKNQIILKKLSGTVSTPTMFVNDKKVANPSDVNSWGLK